MLLACCLCINSCCGLCLMNQDPDFFSVLQLHLVLADLAEWKQWCSRLPQWEGSHFKWKNGGCQRVRCWPFVGWTCTAVVSKSSGLIFFWGGGGGGGGGIKLVLRIVHFAVASRRLRSHIKLENCSFGRLRRMHNADLYPFDCHRCGLKEPWHCLSVWSWHILKVHWEENKVGIEDDYPWRF